MYTYNFIVTQNEDGRSVEVNANSEEEAMDRLRKAYPEAEGWYYITV